MRIFGILLLFILFACCSQFDLYLLSFWSTRSTFNSYEISSFLLWSKRVYPAVLKNFISIDESISRGRNTPINPLAPEFPFKF